MRHTGIRCTSPETNIPQQAVHVSYYPVDVQWTLLLVVPLSRFGDTLLGIWVVGPQNWTAVLKAQPARNKWRAKTNVAPTTVRSLGWVDTGKPKNSQTFQATLLHYYQKPRKSPHRRRKRWGANPHLAWILTIIQRRFGRPVFCVLVFCIYIYIYIFSG